MYIIYIIYSIIYCLIELELEKRYNFPITVLNFINK